MILLNKNTGEIIIGKSFTDIVNILHERKDPIVSSSLLDLNLFAKHWKEIGNYVLKEPLIKDKKVRDAIRSWAEANGIESKDTIIFDSFEHRFTWINTSIEFNESKPLLALDETYYTINELCSYIEEKNE